MSEETTITTATTDKKRRVRMFKEDYINKCKSLEVYNHDLKVKLENANIEIDDLNKSITNDMAYISYVEGKFCKAVAVITVLAGLLAIAVFFLAKFYFLKG